MAPTYGEMAIAVGSTPGAAWAVGRWMAINPWPPLVPCHRVLGKDGSLTGFGGGLHANQRLLLHERHVAAGWQGSDRR